jgi:predicted tellurium resistance membrane protein TerC
VEGLLTTENLLALLTLSVLEIVLGIDNIVFISILAGKLPQHQQKAARQLGLTAAMLTRILLLLGIGWVMRLTEPLFTLLSREFAGKDLILLAGGLFLVAKATYEIHQKLEGPAPAGAPRAVASFGAAIAQIMLLDIVFSLDSVITAVGMARRIEIMIAAVVLSVLVMLAFAGIISAFIERHPTLKMLALAFLLLIGVMLVAEGLGTHVNKGYIYFAMGFSLFVELINLRVRKAHEPVHLHGAPAE